MNILIIAAGENKNPKRLLEYANAADYIICADAGYTHAKQIGIVPDILVGDFDSLQEEPADFLRKVKLPVEKDETDTLYALRFAFSKGATKVIVYGGIGTRFDHSYANICLLQHAMVRDISMTVTDGETEIYLTDSMLTLTGKKGQTVSVYSFSDVCEGVTLKGFYYSLENAFLEKYDIVGTSNIITEDVAEITVSSGNLLVVCNQTE